MNLTMQTNFLLAAGHLDQSDSIILKWIESFLGVVYYIITHLAVLQNLYLKRLWTSCWKFAYLNRHWGYRTPATVIQSFFALGRTCAMLDQRSVRKADGSSLESLSACTKSFASLVFRVRKPTTWNYQRRERLFGICWKPSADVT